MLPTIGRIIHVYEPLNDQCLAAIVTALDYGVRVTVPTVFCTVFPPHGSITDASHRMVLPDQGTWHDPRDCHPRVNGMPVSPDGTVDDRQPQHSTQGDHHVYPDDPPALGRPTS